ncbi:MAG: DNRLRE domain-containing protein [Chloroflexi bacterium]|nr:DNRLRE domain-containing protein [Chloroflexota bacterium]
MRRLIISLLAGTVLIALIGMILTAFSAPAQAEANPNTPARAQSTRILDATWQLHPPVVDGDLSDWASYEHVVLNSETADATPGGYLPTPADLSGWTAVVWDSQWLYIALNVVDDIVVRDSRNWEHDDMAGYVFDVDRDGQLSVEDMRFTLSPDGLVTLNGGWPFGVQSNIAHTAQGWQAEIAIPLIFFGSDFLSNAQVGFSWGLQDDDGHDIESRLVWGGSSYTAPTPDEGTMRFINGPTRSWLTYHLGDEGWAGIEDTTLNSWPGNTSINFGSDPILAVRGNDQWHAAMKIILPELPTGARPLGLLLHMSLADIPHNPNNSGATWARAYPLLRPWDENTATWRQAATGTLWARGGADAVGVDREGTVAVETHLISTQRDFTWDLSSVVGDWFDDPAQNYGILLRGESGDNVLYQFNSADCTPAASCGPWIELFVEFPPPTVIPTPTPIPTDTPTPTPNFPLYLPLMVQP